MHTYHLLPPLLCLTAAITLFLWPRLLPWMTDAVVRFAKRPGYWHIVCTGVTVHLPASPLPVDAIAPSADRLCAALHGLIVTLPRVSLALTSVYQHEIRDVYASAPFSKPACSRCAPCNGSHPGDYVLRLSVGVSSFRLLANLLLGRAALGDVRHLQSQSVVHELLPGSK